MSRLRRVVLVAVAVAGAIALVAIAGGCDKEQPALDGTSWKLIAWAGEEGGPKGLTITAKFANGVISGNSGVNTYSGPYESTTDGAFSVGELQSTMMAGSQEAMDAEAKYLRHLKEATSYVVTETQVALKNEQGQRVLIFTAYEQ
jgi:heat shock protein HslJ